jgi:hypothetical protein
MQIGNGFVDRLAAGGPALGAVRTVFGEWIDAFDGGRV